MASNQTAADFAPSEPQTVHVRMYRALGFHENGEGSAAKSYKGLLGDCFLIRLTRGEATSHILIDCGILTGSPFASQRMQAIAQDIVRTTGGSITLDANGNIVPVKPGTLDLLVITHEHWDHISGFSHAQDILLDDRFLKIHATWMGWTEKDGDPQVVRLRTRFDHAARAFAALAQRMDQQVGGMPSLKGDDPRANLCSLQKFLGVDAEHPSRKLLAREIMGKLKEATQPDFLEPGMVLNTPSAISNGPSLKAFVLGPPRDEKLLFKDKPSSGSARETYFDPMGLVDQIHRTLAADDANAPDVQPNSHSVMPFGSKDQIVQAAALAGKVAKNLAGQGKELPLSAEEAWFAERYFGVPQSVAQNAPDEAAVKRNQAMQVRRRIDDDWMAAAGPLALKLDSDTNNTSLVLAFDLPDGTAMLFAADAQVGNWESWHTRTYKEPGGQEHSAEQILNRTRFYKVGHHGSHNATLNKQGLAMMTHPGLVAAISTDEDLGAMQPGRWQMPNPRVNTALMACTAGRIMRNDRRYSADDIALFGKDPHSGAARLADEDLYLEYRVL